MFNEKLFRDIIEVHKGISPEKWAWNHLHPHHGCGCTLAHCGMMGLAPFSIKKTPMLEGPDRYFTCVRGRNVSSAWLDEGQLVADVLGITIPEAYMLFFDGMHQRSHDGQLAILEKFLADKLNEKGIANATT